MLLEKKTILPLLRCPKSGEKLNTLNDDVLIANSPSGMTKYEIIDDYPILINFDQSILLKANIKELTSSVDRHSYNGLLNIAKELVCTPCYVTDRNVKKIMKDLLKDQDVARVLIVGGGTIGQGMEPFYLDKQIELVSFDIYKSPFVQFLGDAHNIPLADNSFDAVIIQAVLEHVLNPIKVVSEIHRVLHDDGIVYAETPFLQHVHEGAYDFTRYTESGHRYLFKHFSVIKSGACSGAGTQLLWAFDYFFCGLFRSKWIGKFVKFLLFWLQFFDRIIPESYNVDAASGVYFLGKKESKSICNSDLITHYKGSQR